MHADGTPEFEPAARRQLTRFCLYGFLKNQQYFEPFLVLVFLEKGLTFLHIGLLIAFRELVINLFEILSGALADLWGRRRAMILSFCAYIGSFILFGLAENLALRQQINVLQRSVKRPKLRKRDRIFWVWLSRLLGDWRNCCYINSGRTEQARWFW